jgi:hypothetical protein
MELTSELVRELTASESPLGAVGYFWAVNDLAEVNETLDSFESDLRSNILSMQTNSSKARKLGTSFFDLNEEYVNQLVQKGFHRFVSEVEICLIDKSHVCSVETAPGAQSLQRRVSLWTERWPGQWSTASTATSSIR